MKKLMTLALTVLAISCSKPMIAAFGSNSEILIVTTPRCSEEAMKLKNILSREIVTVQYEPAFKVRIVTKADLRTELNRKNVLLLDYLSPESRLEGKIRDVVGQKFDELERGETYRYVVYDRWARGQAVMVVTAPTKQDLNRLLDEKADEIFNFVETCVQTRLNKALFYGGEQKVATKRLLDTYGWTLRLPTGYKIDETYASERVVKIMEDKPARMITVYWEGGQWSDESKNCLDRKRMLAWQYWDEDEVVDETLRIEEGEFLGHKAIVLSGTWENKKYTIGGIFVTYCFSCPEAGRHYVVDAAVFAPGLDKLPLLRELKAILSTFECKPRAE